MALEAVNERVRGMDAEHLLDVLPCYKSMRWINYPDALPPKALVIGTVDDVEILAFCKQCGGKAREIRYSLKPRNVPAHKARPNVLFQDDVIGMELFAPFKYNAGSSKAEKRRFSIVIKYYFLLAGLIQDSIGGDIADYCKRFIGALQKIQDAEQTERNPSKPQKEYSRGTRGTARVVNESQESQESRTNDSPDSHDYIYIVSSSPAEMSAEDSPEDSESDYDKLKEYLNEQGTLYLLGNLPEADEVQFANQNFLSEARPRKLFIGKHAENAEDIYALMRKVHNHHEIRYFTESGKSLAAEDIGQHKILHPFNKTYPKDCAVLEQTDKARLAVTIKWYFVAAGIAKNVVLKESTTFAYRFKTTLQAIARRMGEASVQPPAEASTADTDANEGTPDSQIEESRIQSDLCANESIASQSPQASRVRVEGPVSSPTAQRGTKRTVEDADFEGLRRLVKDDEGLTKEIEDVDQHLEMLEMERQNFLEKRQRLDTSRKEIRRQFKRQSLAVARSSSSS